MLWEEVLDPNSELGQMFMKCWELERELKGVEDLNWNSLKSSLSIGR